MSFDTNDPRLTAFALGELDASERAEVEALLADDVSARQAVEETNAVAAILADAFKNEHGPGLASAHRSAIESELTPATVVLPNRASWRWWGGYALAASALIAVSGTFLWRAWHPEANIELARNDLPNAAAPAAPANQPSNDLGFAARPQAKSAAPLAAEPAPAPADFDAIQPKSARELHSDSKKARVEAHYNVALTDRAKDVSNAETRLYAQAREPAGGADDAAKMPERLSSAAATPATTPAAGSGAAGGIAGAAPSPPMPGPPPGAAKADDYAKFGKPEGARGLGADGESQQPPRRMTIVEAKVGQQRGADVRGRVMDGEAAAGFARKSPADGLKEQMPKSLNRAKRGETAQGMPTERFGLESLPKFNAQKSGASQPAPNPRDEGLTQQLGESKDRFVDPKENRAEDRKQLAERLHDEAEVVRRMGRAAEIDNAPAPKAIENEFVAAAKEPLSTFSIDVDTASYSNIRAYLSVENKLPPANAVRVEEMVNYFAYDYAPPTGDAPFSINTEVARCPWQPEHRLVRIGLKGKMPANRPATNLVFLIDVSGSMETAEKLPLVKAGLRMLVEQLGEADQVAIVTYAGNSRVALPSTNGLRKPEIASAIDQLVAAGSTNGSGGIQLAYEQAMKRFIKDGVNRVILCTDGDFNVGITETDKLVAFVKQKADESKVALTVLGFGRGNWKDTPMEQIADKGNGHIAYIDSLQEARKVLVEQTGSTLVTIAKDVKIQVDFNAAKVARYRLIGYENRALANQDFHDDSKDAGEIGAGHSVTALYEVAPFEGSKGEIAAVADSSRYAKLAKGPEGVRNSELLTVEIAYKAPGGDRSSYLTSAVADRGNDYSQASVDFKFAASVASFGMLLRDSKFKGSTSYDSILELATASVGSDRGGYRREFLDLVRLAKGLSQPLLAAPPNE